jgi:hypothetical protein
VIDFGSADFEQRLGTSSNHNVYPVTRERERGRERRGERELGIERERKHN